MIVRRALTGFGIALLVAISGCTSSGTATTATTTAPPTAPEVLAASSAAMATVTSAAFDLTVDGDLPAVTVEQGAGVLNADGDAKGTATVEQFGQLIEVEFVLVDGTLYLKGITGGFSEVPAALAGSVYDPSAILDPDRGVAKVLSSVTAPTITETQDDAWTVSGTVPAAVAGGLVPGITTDVDADLVISRSTSELTDATFTLDGADGKPATVTVGLSDFNEPVEISTPG